MRKFLRWLGIVLAVLLGLALIAAFCIWLVSARAMSRSYDAVPEHLAKPTPAQLADGPRQARILGCVSCHGEGLKGKLMFDVPAVARVYAPNLTLIAANATDQQLAQAIRQGISHDGRGLWVMPSGPLSRLDGGEVAALISFIRAQKVQPGQTPPIALGPLGRIGVTTGGLEGAAERIETYRTKTPLFVGKAHEAGRRLAAIGCAECHGPSLEGAEIAGEKAPDLQIAGAYDFAQFKTPMRTGKGVSKPNLGLMSEVAKSDFSHLTDDELGALHSYLRARAERAQP
jgi:cytochrome c553